MRPRRIIQTTTLTAILAFLAFRHSGNGDEKVTPPPPDPVLSRIVPKADFNGTGLAEALQSLSDQTKVPIHVDWRRLESAGINASLPVTVHRSDAALGDVLAAVLSSAGANTVKLSYAAADGEIAVADLESIASVRICRIYDIADLVDELEMSQWPADGITTGFGPRTRFRWQPPEEYLLVYLPHRFRSIAGETPEITGSPFHRREMLQSLLTDFFNLPWTRWNSRPIWPIGDQFILIATAEEHAVTSAFLRELRQHHLPDLYRGRLNDGPH